MSFSWFSIRGMAAGRKERGKKKNRCACYNRLSDVTQGSMHAVRDVSLVANPLLHFAGIQRFRLSTYNDMCYISTSRIKKSGDSRDILSTCDSVMTWFVLLKRDNTSQNYMTNPGSEGRYSGMVQKAFFYLSTVAYRLGRGLNPPPRNSEVLTKSNRIANWVENV